ncbi:hypothetical protein KMW28_05045 [Flammeovirga yaeyamensis]|uniref:YD repeat-containing protein n=1 Tax=Flammeovirga yaeyamensis TaxID=367791 RepID=A0AAX1NBD0_9BACT|nr:hypothetical protein [Flammeovirga yaeyamensis]MBB3697525.1 hypothetical protein [Flammeovirga yaeyamensis]NMF36219.1 hypothetical protein [Flammeovirga yaeyamensis]QWG02948.1 hypothetical protein KMW28_05045 [Flammeovirga yaeyamensis]
MKISFNKLFFILYFVAVLSSCTEEKVTPEIVPDDDTTTEVEEKEPQPHPQRPLFRTDDFIYTFDRIMRGCYGGNYVMTSELDGNTLLKTTASIPQLGKFGEDIITFKHITDEYDSVITTNVTFNDTDYQVELDYEMTNSPHLITYINSSTGLIRSVKNNLLSPFNRILHESYSEGDYNLIFYNQHGTENGLGIDRFENNYPIPYDGHVAYDEQNRVAIVEIPGSYGYRYEYTYDDQQRFSTIKCASNNYYTNDYIKRFEYFEDHFVVNINYDENSSEKGYYDVYYGMNKKVLKSRNNQDTYYVDTYFALDTAHLMLYNKEHLIYKKDHDNEGQLSLILKRTIEDQYVRNSEVKFNVYDTNNVFLGTMDFHNNNFTDTEGVIHGGRPEFLEDIYFSYGVTFYNPMSTHIPF